jgi:hypothetical protein
VGALAVARRAFSGPRLRWPDAADPRRFDTRFRLAITHVIDFLPGVKPYDSTIVVEFFPAGERVRMVVTLSPMHDEEFSRMQKEGFTSQLAS